MSSACVIHFKLCLSTLFFREGTPKYFFIFCENVYRPEEGDSMEDSLITSKLLSSKCNCRKLLCVQCAVYSKLHCKEKIDLLCLFLYGNCCNIANYQTEIPAIFQGIFRNFFVIFKHFYFSYSLIFCMSPAVFCGTLVGKHHLNARLSNTPV